MTSTYSNEESKPLTIENLKCVADVVSKREVPLSNNSKWLKKIMAKFGWHRQYEIIIIDKAKLNHMYFQRPKL